MADQQNLPPGPVSGRGLARLLGLTENAVRTARAAGRLRRCIVPGGYDPAIAVEEWRETTDPRQQRKVTSATDAAAAADAARVKGKAAPAKVRPARAAPSGEPAPAAGGRRGGELDARLAAHRAARLTRPTKAAPTRDDEDAGGDGDGRSVAQIRKDMLLVEEQSDLIDFHAKVGAALPRSTVLDAVQTLGREYRDSTLRIADQYAPQIAGELGLEAHVVHGVLDRYLLMHFEKVIAKIVDERVAPAPDAAA